MQSIEPRAQIDALLAQTRQNHFRLTHITDNKAHILIVISAVSLNIAVAQAALSLYKWAAITMVVQALCTIVFASLSIMPSVYRGKTKDGASGDDHIQSSFATGFVQYDYPTFMRLMEHTLRDPAKTYEMQMKEIYDSGWILVHKKFRLLRFAFLSFLCGSGLTIVVLVAEMLRMTP